MFYSPLLLAATAFTGLVRAQVFNGQNYSVSGPIAVVPSSVDLTLRNSWCIGQQNTCPLICNGAFASNNCTAETLEYSCTCQSGTTPNISAYMETLPFYVCERWRDDCTAAHPNDLFAQAGCHSLVCGMLNASETESGGSSASSSASAMTTTMATTTSGSADATSTTGTPTATTAATSSGAAVMNVAKQYGTGILASGLLALFGLAL